jgi:hypothetical protein
MMACLMLSQTKAMVVGGLMYLKAITWAKVTEAIETNRMHPNRNSFRRIFMKFFSR